MVNPILERCNRCTYSVMAAKYIYIDITLLDSEYCHTEQLDRKNIFFCVYRNPIMIKNP